MSSSDRNVPVNSIPPGSSNWPRLRNGSGEKIKNWAALLMGVAALLTATGTYYKPVENDKEYKIAYEQARKEIVEISVDVRNLSTDVERLYRLRKEEDHRRIVAAELESSAYEIEDEILRKELTRRFGKTYADKFMDQRKKLRIEIRQEYVQNLKRRELPEAHVAPTKRDLPDFGSSE